MNYEDDIKNMFDRHKLSREVVPTLVDAKVFADRLQLIGEEVGEIAEAYEKQDLTALLDGLVDLVVVTIGAAVRMGLPFDAAWNIVLDTNINMKERGFVAKRESMAEDLRKRANFVPPETRIAELLLRKGSKGNALAAKLSVDPVLYKNQAVICRAERYPADASWAEDELVFTVRDEEGNHSVVYCTPEQVEELRDENLASYRGTLLQFTTDADGTYTLEMFI